MLSLSTTEKVTVVFYVCSRLSETAVVVGYQYLYTYVDEHLTCLTDFLIKTKVIYLCLILFTSHTFFEGYPK